MHKYFVELDGTSIIMSEDLLEKNDFLKLNEDGEINFYRVGNVNKKNVSLKLIKAIENKDDGVRYDYSDIDVFYENRISKNQTILVDGLLYKVLSIEKKTNKLELESVNVKTASSVFGVYESKSHEGLDVRDRETVNYLAEKYFSRKGEAFGYVMQERSKGRKVSL